MMNAWQWHGSAYEPCNTLPVEDRGFRYGMALFESLRIHRGAPLFFAEHIGRLRQACLDRDFACDPAALDAVDALFRGAGRDGFGRIYVTAGDGPLHAPTHACRIIAMLEDRAQPAKAAYDLALPRGIYHPLFGGLKTANYWANIDILQQAVKRGFDEALLFNEHAELVSVCMANIFVVHGGTIRTPALACGAREGVIREWVMQRAPVKQGSIFMEDLQTADEVFITNSWLGVMPVQSIEGRQLNSSVFARELQEGLSRVINPGA